MKKILKMMFVLALLLVQIVPQTLVNAAGTNSNDGTITINDVVEGKTYTIYQMLELESYDETKGTYSYKVVDEKWETFLRSQTTYVEVDDQDYVTWKEVEGETEPEKNARVAAFSKLALDHAKTNSLTSKTITASGAELKTDGEGNKYIKFTGLNLGYYLVDSSVGTLCGLTTTDKDAEIDEKNTVPTTKKEVEEDSTGEFGESNTAQIGQVVNFKTTITIGEGAINYVLHDTMTEGLTLDLTSIKVYKNAINEGNLVATTNYTVIPNATTESTTDGCTFDIIFNNDYIKTLTSSDTLVVTYSATVNEKAKIETDENTNTTHLSYGDNGNHTTEPSETTTYTYSFEVIKTNTSHEMLTGATFNLYTKVINPETQEESYELINLVSLGENNDGFNVYRVATDDEVNEEGFETAIIEAGKVIINGLDSDTYYLDEVNPPVGYNKLPGKVAFTVNGTTLTSNKLSFDPQTGELKVNEDNEYVDGGLEVINKTGSELPSTGGIGTMIFILVGTMMVLGFGVLLVTKFRMSKYSA